MTIGLILIKRIPYSRRDFKIFYITERGRLYIFGDNSVYHISKWSDIDGWWAWDGVDIIGTIWPIGRYWG